MVHRLFFLERTINYRDFEPTRAIELLGAVNLLNTVLDVSPFVKIVVLEFYLSMTKGMGDPTSHDFQTVCSKSQVRLLTKRYQLLPSLH